MGIQFLSDKGGYEELLERLTEKDDHYDKLQAKKRREEELERRRASQARNANQRERPPWCLCAPGDTGPCACD